MSYIGARFALYPMRGDFVEVILGALAEVPRDGLVVETDDVSTFVQGPEDQMLGWIRDVTAAAARRGGHLVCSLLLSRGCPGEETCEADPAASPGPVHVRQPAPPTGIRCAAHFSLYPLGIPEYMDVIYREIGRAKKAGVYRRAEHFASRLEGDLADVFGAVQDCWDRAEADARHVVAHVTISVGSPTAEVDAR